MGALKQECPVNKIRVASMGAISKPDGTVRPLHDGTHGVLVNNHIHLVNQVAVPGPAEMAFAVRSSRELQEVPLAVSADVSSAHRLYLHRREDWALLACRASSDSKTIWINKVGTFGISSASFWWSRLFGIIGRCVARAMLQHSFYQFAYVDDIHTDFYGRRKYINFLAWLVLHEMIGTPFAYHKFKGGTIVSFIGYELDFGSRLLGLSEARGQWICEWVTEVVKSRFVVSVRRFNEFLGRLGFVARVVYWIKPHLAPLYAWSSVASKSHVAKLPDTVILTLLYLRETLSESDFKVAPSVSRLSEAPAFYTDAKCADDLVVLGGWDAHKPHGEAKWFSLRVTREQAPYLFDAEGRSQWASGSAELLATLVALWIFGYLANSLAPRQIPICLPAVTDNRGNQFLLKKPSTTKWPLMLINMQLSHLLKKSCLRLKLTWRPREENTLADQLTNEVFDSFDLRQRLSVSWNELPLSMLDNLWSTKSDFDQSRKDISASAPNKSRKRKADKTPW